MTTKRSITALDNALAICRNFVYFKNEKAQCCIEGCSNFAKEWIYEVDKDGNFAWGDVFHFLVCKKHADIMADAANCTMQEGS